MRIYLSTARIEDFDTLLQFFADDFDSSFKETEAALIEREDWGPLRQHTQKLAFLRSLKEYKGLPAGSDDHGWFTAPLILQRMTYMAKNLKAEGFDEACTQVLTHIQKNAAEAKLTPGKDFEMPLDILAVFKMLAPLVPDPDADMTIWQLGVLLVFQK